MDKVIKDAKKLSILNERILDITIHENKSFTIDKKRFNLNNLITETVKGLQCSLDFIDQIKFEYDLKDEYIVYADKIRIGQVISYLIENSVKSIEEQIRSEKK